MGSEMEDYIKQIRKEGDTVGGVITCVIQDVPAGLGEPVFNKLHAELGKAMLSINAVKGFEYGSGLRAPKTGAAITMIYTMPMERPEPTSRVEYKGVFPTEWTSTLKWPS